MVIDGGDSVVVGEGLTYNNSDVGVEHECVSGLIGLCIFSKHIGCHTYIILHVSSNSGKFMEEPPN